MHLCNNLKDRVNSKTLCVCHRCNKEFYEYTNYVKKGKGKYCSKDCSNRGRGDNNRGENNPRWVKKLDVICPICGKVFKATPHEINTGAKQTCSYECGRKSASRKLTGSQHYRWIEKDVKQCEYCGKQFDVRPNSTDPNRFCSNKCFGKWRSEIIVGENHHSWRRMIVSCFRCGKEFTIQPNVAKRSKRYFCSRECRKDRVKTVCASCGKDLDITRRRYDSVKRNFCSGECKGKWISENIFGDKHPNWLGGSDPYPPEWNKKIRELIRDRDDRTCQVCGLKENGRKLDVHHIDYNPKNIIPDNLISLCRSCHPKTNFNREYWIEFFKGREIIKNAKRG